MSYTPESVKKLVSLYRELEEAEAKLDDFCNEVALHMAGWQSAEKVRVNGDMVLFVACGSYKSSKRQDFQFPVRLLMEDAEKAAAYCMLM